MAKNYTGSNNIIKSCVVVGKATSNFTGGFVGSDCYCDITDSYSLYDTNTNLATGGFYYQNAHGTITTSYYLKNTSFGTESNSFISTTNTNSVLNIINCATSGSSFGNSLNITLSGTCLTNYTTSTSNSTSSSPISSFDGVIWNKSITPPIISAFTNTIKWSGYSKYTDVPTVTFSSGTFAQGDPHISTMDGNFYDLDIYGAFKLFDNNFSENRLIINGLIEDGDGMFKFNKYIRKVLIYQNGKKLLVDMGFRGCN